MKGIVALLLWLSSAGLISAPLLAQLIDGPPEWALSGGAIGILTFVLWYVLTSTVPGLQKDMKDARDAYIKSIDNAVESYKKSVADERAGFTDTLDKMAERHERWETQRHADSDLLRETLAELRENCAAANARIIKANKEG